MSGMIRRPKPLAALRFLVLGLLFTALSSPPARIGAAPQARLVFGAERFERTSGAPDVFTREFSIPSSIVGPFVLTVINGQASGTGRVAIEDAVAAGRIRLNGEEIVSPSDFSVRVGQIDRQVVPAVTNMLEVTLGSSPGSFITVSIAGVLDLQDMTNARSGHTATVLADGSVLITGGKGPGGLESGAERFNPSTRTFAVEGGSMVTGRAHHTSSVLPDGRHLLTSGSNDTTTIGSNELFDPGDGLFTSLPASLLASRAGHTATVLDDGRVLIAGGREIAELGSTEAFDGQSAALFKPPFDASTGRFVSLTYQLAEPRFDHTATLLPDGRVLITGGQNASGILSSVEVFGPAIDAFRLLTASLPAARAGHSATLLPDGRVLLLGGRNDSGYLDSGVVFDPATDTFSAAAEHLDIARAHHTATLLHHGEILVAGGESASGALAQTALIKPAGTDTVSPRAVHFNPGQNATGVDLTQVISVRFSEPLAVATVHAETVSLGGAAPTTSAVAISEDGLLVFIVPTSPLVAGSQYVVSLSNAITDTSGNPLESASLTFTTVAAPVIDTIQPPAGFAGSPVSILGSNFDPLASEDIVSIGASLAVVAGATDTQIDTTVPADALAGETLVMVTTRGGSATAVFTVLNVVPVIASLEPATAEAGSAAQMLSIIGSGFAPGAYVTFGNSILLPGVRTPARLDVEVPASLLTSIGATDVTVTNLTPGGGTSNAMTFTVRGVRISSLAPASGAPGTTVTISGEGFEPVAASNQVFFNGSAAIVTSATDTVIEAVVPQGASSGPITVVTPLGQAESGPFTVTAAATLLLSKIPDQPVYAPGAPITVSTLLVDPSGGVVPDIAVELTSFPQESERAGNTFRYFADGIYTITARAIIDGALIPITASTQVRIETQTASIACDAPLDGGMVTATAGSSMTVSGSVSAPAGVMEFTVNGVPTAVGPSGAFAAPIITVWGVNLVKLSATTASGQQTRHTCAFLLSSTWAPDTQALTDVVSARQTQAAIDDGSRSGAIGSFADVLHTVLNSTGLETRLHTSLLGANPLKANSCDSQTCTFLGCVCWYRSGVTYEESQVVGPRTVSLTLLTGGVRSMGRLEDIRIRLQVIGAVGPIPYNTSGVVRISFMEVQATHDLGISAGRPSTSIRPDSVTTTVGTISTEFSGVDGFILDNVIVPLVQGQLRNMVRNVIRDWITNNFNGALDGVLEGIAPDSLDAALDVLRLDETGTLQVNLSPSVSTLQSSASRMLTGMAMRVSTAPAHARPTLGAAIPSGPRLFDTTSASIANVMHAGFLNQGLHALWRGGYFDTTLTAGMLGGAVPEGVTLTTTATLPPAALIRDPERLEIAMGAVRMQLAHPSLAQPLNGTLGGRISCGVRLESELLRLEACTVDDLDLVTEAVLSESEDAEVHELLGDALRAILVRASHGAVPAFPLLGYQIPQSLAPFGLPPGARLGVINPALRRSNNHLVVEGAFGIR